MNASDAARRPDRRRTLGATAVIVVLLGVLIALVSVRNSGEKVINADGGTLVLVGKASGDGMDAVGGGVLADVGGCLGWKDGSRSTVVVWPHGTNVDTTNPLRFKIAGTTYAIGDRIEVGGGQTGPLDPTSYFYDRVPQACRTADVWVANAS